MKKIFFAIIFISINISLFAQVRFKKAYIINVDDKYILKSENTYKDGYSCFYLDESNKIKKYYSWAEYPDSYFFIIAYYNDEGKITSIIFKNDVPEGYSYHGSIVVNNNTMICEYNYKSDLDTCWQKNSKNIKNISFDIFGWEIDSYFNIENLMLKFNFKELKIPNNLKESVFYLERGRTIINRNNVNVRNLPNLTAEIIDRLNVGDRVEIIDIINGKEGCWCKIKYEKTNQYVGYVFSEYLEKIEKKYN